MKSAVSSSSSGSEKVGGSGVASSVGYDLEESKPKSTSRMSCASDDSCAINELLEGRMDLNVTLPNSGESVVFNVERRTPMLDLLVNIATQYRFNAANYTINAGDHDFKASTPIGSLDVNQILIIPKPTKSASLKSGPSVIPFQTTFRLQVNLPRNQLMVLRVTPNASIAAIKQIICSEKSLDSSKYQLVRFAGNSEGPQILEPNKTLAYYTLNEVTLVSNKTLAQIEIQYGTPTTSQVDMSDTRTTSTGVSANKKTIQSLIISQSNPDFTTIDDKTVLNHTNPKPIKKRPAPPPPMPSSATLPNNLLSVQINGNKNENNITNLKNDDSIIKTAVSESIIETKSESKLSKSVVNHVRQNSGSDSSGYHESVLSSDSPESSSAVATLPKSSSTTASISALNISNKQAVNNKTVTKKRRAPPPPSSQHLNTHQENNNKLNENNIEENKVAVECMSDVSPPLSTSSSSTSDSSGTASSINNRSLSPIVITQTNGSSTPLRTSMNSIEVASEPSLTPTSPQLEDKQEESPPATPTQIIDDNPDQSESVETSFSNDVLNVEEVTHTEAGLVNAAHNSVDEELSSDKLQESLDSARTEPIMCQQNDNLDIKDNEDNNNNEKMLALNQTSISIHDRNDSNDSDLNKNSASITSINAESDAESPTESLPKEAEVSCIAPALAVSHDNDLSGHDYVEQVEERDISNIIDNEKQGVNQLYSNEKSDNHNNECESDPIQNMSEFELAEMSLPLPPPSPFQNSNHDEHNSSVHDCDDEMGHMGQGVHQLNSPTSVSDTINEQIIDKLIVNEQIKDVIKNSHTIDHNIKDTIEPTISYITSDSNKSQPESETTTPLIVSDEDELNKEIEVTLQSFNDELDRLESKDESEFKDLNNKQLVSDKLEANYAMSAANQTNDNKIQTNTQEVNRNNSSKVSVQVKQTTANSSEIETIKSELEKRESPSPTPRILSSVNGKSKLIMNRDDSQPQVSKSSNGKTTLIINKTQTPTPPISPSPSISPTPSNEDKFTAEKVREVCRPKVKLTNFSIGSYKKDVDIYEETKRTFRSESPSTAPVISTTSKPFVVTASVKQENNAPIMNQNKSKVNITATSTTATNTFKGKPTSPVIQTLITTAPKINRIQSWSGQKSLSLDQKYTKQPVKTNERYVSQIAINKDSKNISPAPQIESAEDSKDLKTPQLVVQNLIARTESQIKNRSPSPQDLPQKGQPIKEHTMISIKPGLESIIRSHIKQQNSSDNKIGNELNSVQTVPQNSSKQSITIGKTHVQLKSTQIIKPPIESAQLSDEQSMQPLIPPPIPPPLPQNISSFPISNNKTKSTVNTKIFHTKGWNSEKVTGNGKVPKVKHVDPPNNSVDVRDALLNEIKKFGGKNSLKKVSKNSSWQLEVNGNTVKT